MWYLQEKSHNIIRIKDAVFLELSCQNSQRTQTHQISLFKYFLKGFFSLFHSDKTRLYSPHIMTFFSHESLFYPQCGLHCPSVESDFKASVASNGNTFTVGSDWTRLSFCSSGK